MLSTPAQACWGHLHSFDSAWLHTPMEDKILDSGVTRCAIRFGIGLWVKIPRIGVTSSRTFRRTLKASRLSASAIEKDLTRMFGITTGNVLVGKFP